MWVVFEKLGQWRLRTWVLVALGIAVLLFCYHLRAVLNPLLVGLLLAYILNPSVQWLESKGLGRVGGIVVVYLVLLVAAAVTLAFAIPVLYDQAYQGYYAVAGEPLTKDRNGNGRYDTHFLDRNGDTQWDPGEPFEYIDTRTTEAPEGSVELPDLYADINRNAHYDHGYLWHVLTWASPDEETVNQLMTDLRDQAGTVARVGVRGVEWIFNQAMAGLSGVLNVLSWLLLVPVYAFFLLLKLPEWRDQTVKYLPGPYRDRIVSVATRIHHSTSDFFRGRLILCVVYGIMNAIGFSLCGVPFALIFGVLIGIFSLIPVFGTVIVGVPVMVLAYVGADGGLLRVFYVFLVLIITQMIDGWVLTPYVLGRSAGLNPVVVVISIFIGGALMGLFGMLIAVPAASAIKILFLEFVEPSLLAIAAETPAPVPRDPPPAVPPGPPGGGADG